MRYAPNLICLSNAQVDVLVLRCFPTTYLALIKFGVAVPSGDRPLEGWADPSPDRRLWRSRIIDVSVSQLGLVSVQRQSKPAGIDPIQRSNTKPFQYQVSLGRLQGGALTEDR